MGFSIKYMSDRRTPNRIGLTKVHGNKKGRRKK
jgi:hypothetical protein